MPAAALPTEPEPIAATFSENPAARRMRSDCDVRCIDREAEEPEVQFVRGGGVPLYV